MTSITRHGDLTQHIELSEHGELSHHGDFDPEQVAMLQDLARNGAPEAQMYSYPEDGGHGNGTHLNGYGDDASNDGHENGLLSFSDAADNPGLAYSRAGLLQSQQDLDLEDPAALLESLANFEHPASNNNVPISNDHFASLLQAAATAGGQEEARVDLGRTRRSTRQSRAAEQFESTQNYTPDTRPRRGQNDKISPPEIHGFVIRGNKRKRQVDEIDEEEQLAREREIWGPEETEEEDQSFDENQYVNRPIATSDARAAGVHSAAALFRRPSSASKKYTRPPMSKLFTSLELSPEQFLHLQAAAKTYMLDPHHPERRDCVGNRGRGDTDMVKLKLFGCVKTFLEDEGWGDKCFGSTAEGAESRKLKWPQMKNKVISLVTPLLRRMVTNERQRQYAIETRKPAPSSAKAVTRKTNERQSSPLIRTHLQQPSAERESSPRYPEIDPKLDQYHYNLDPSFATTATAAAEMVSGVQDRPCIDAETSGAQTSSPAPTSAEESTTTYHINILSDNTRIHPRLSLTRSNCPGFSSLIQHVRSALSNENVRLIQVRILLPEGLRAVGEEVEWQEALSVVAEQEWMDGELRVLVDVGHE